MKAKEESRLDVLFLFEGIRCSIRFLGKFSFFSFEKVFGDWTDIGRENKKEKSEKDSFPWFQNFIS